MANTLLPIEERNLTPDQVELLDKRRRRGQLFLVLCLQTLIIGTLVTLWSGQDWTLSPGLTHPMVYWDAVMFTLSLVFGVVHAQQQIDEPVCVCGSCARYQGFRKSRKCFGLPSVQKQWLPVRSSPHFIGTIEQRAIGQMSINRM